MNSFQEQPTTDITTPTTTRQPSVGAILASHRQQASMSLEDVAAQLKLSKRQIEALEQDHFDALPGNTFVRGFVRNYARLLQIDPQPLLNDLVRVLPAEAPQAALPRLQDDAMPILRPHRPSRVGPSALFMLVGVVVALSLAGGWYYINSKHEPLLTLGGEQPVGGEVSRPMTPTPVPTETPVPAAADASPTPVATPEAAAPSTQPVDASPTVTGTPTPVVTPTPVATVTATVPVVTPTTAPQANASPVVADPAAGGDIRLVAKADSWVQITDAGGKKLISELVRAGETRNIAGGKPPYQVRVGNGRSTELYYKGQAVDLLSHLKVDVANVELK